MKKQKTKVIMFASNFSKYGKVQAMKSTLEFLTKDAGCIFAFINDPLRGDVPKVKFGSNTVSGILSPKEINAELAKLEDIHAQ